MNKSRIRRIKPTHNICACGDHAWTRLTQWGVALVDAVDAHLFEKYLWHLKGPRGYYARSKQCDTDGDNNGIFLHCVVLNTTGIDHVDGNGLDCRRQNLRLANRQENARNRRSTRGSRSRYNGVAPVAVTKGRIRKKWAASIFFEKKLKACGYFDFEEDAAICYNYHAAHLFGDFARLNQITQFAHE